MPHDVFISHAHRDKSIADDICKKLELAQLRCWIAPRNISAGEDWTEATRKAIESSRVVVLVFSENANAAPHIEREIAHAFYTGKIIVAFRLTEALPRRDFLFYLGDVCWLDAINTPPERHLEALTTRIEHAALPGTAPKMAVSANILNSDRGALRISDSPAQRVFKRVAVAALAAALLFALWFAWQLVEPDRPIADLNLRPKYSGPSAAVESPPEAKGTKLESAPRYTYSRFGLWVPVNPSPTPFIQRGPQGAAGLEVAAQSTPAPPSPSSNLNQKAGSQPDALPAPSGVTDKPAPERRPQVVDRHAAHRAKSRTKRIARNGTSEGFRFARIKYWLSSLFQ